MQHAAPGATPPEQRTPGTPAQGSSDGRGRRRRAPASSWSRAPPLGAEVCMGEPCSLEIKPGKAARRARSAGLSPSSKLAWTAGGQEAAALVCAGTTLRCQARAPGVPAHSGRRARSQPHSRTKRAGLCGVVCEAACRSRRGGSACGPLAPLCKHACSTADLAACARLRRRHRRQGRPVDFSGPVDCLVA